MKLKAFTLQYNIELVSLQQMKSACIYRDNLYLLAFIMLIMNIKQYYVLRYIFSSLLFSFGVVQIIIQEIEFYYIYISLLEFALIATCIQFIAYTFCFIFSPIRYCFIFNSTDYTHTDLDPLYRSWLTKLGKYNYIFISALDFASSFLLYYSIDYSFTFQFLYYQISTFVFVFLYRVSFGKLSFFRHQRLGLLLVFLGILAVSVPWLILITFYIKSVDKALMVLSSGLLEAILLIWQEFIISRLNHSVEVSLGLRGIAGLIICGICIFSFSFPDLETILQGLEFKTALNWVLFSFLFSCYQFSNLKTLQLADALTVCSFNLGSVGIPFYFYLVAFAAYYAHAYLIISGVIFLFGVLIYNEILVVPCFGLKESVRRSRNKMKALLEIEIMHRAESFQLLGAPK
jgi:hypothetical protein